MGVTIFYKYIIFDYPLLLVTYSNEYWKIEWSALGGVGYLN